MAAQFSRKPTSANRSLASGCAGLMFTGRLCAPSASCWHVWQLRRFRLKMRASRQNLTISAIIPWCIYIPPPASIGSCGPGDLARARPANRFAAWGEPRGSRRFSLPGPPIVVTNRRHAGCRAGQVTATIFRNLILQARPAGSCTALDQTLPAGVPCRRACPPGPTSSGSFVIDAP